MNGQLFSRCCQVSFLLTLRIAACVEVRERRRGARRKARVRKDRVELNTIDFSLSLYKSSKLNTRSPFLSLLSRLVVPDLPVVDLNQYN